MRPSRDWRIIFGYSKESDQIVPMSKSSFYQRIKGESGITIDAVKCGRGYRLRTDQLPSGAKSEALRNDIIKQASEQKKNGFNRRCALFGDFELHSGADYWFGARPARFAAKRAIELDLRFYLST